MRHGDWTPDEILLTLEAYVAVAQSDADPVAIIASLAAELDREDSAVQAAVAALKSSDPAIGTGQNTSRAARALSEALLDDPQEVKRLARCVRELWSRRNR